MSINMCEVKWKSTDRLSEFHRKAIQRPCQRGASLLVRHLIIICHQDLHTGALQG